MSTKAQRIAKAQKILEVQESVYRLEIGLRSDYREARRTGRLDAFMDLIAGMNLKLTDFMPTPRPRPAWLRVIK